MAKGAGGETSRRNTRGRDVADNQFGGGGGGGGTAAASSQLARDARALTRDRNSVPGGISAVTRRAFAAGLSSEQIRRVLESL